MPYMSPSAHKVYTVAAIREVEQRAIASLGMPEATLMQRAGAAAFEVLKARWPEVRRIAVVCGPGNNGGDGRVLMQLAEADGMTLCELDEQPDLIVDALFGIGLSRAPEGESAELIIAMNRSAAPVLSIDIPSGLDADNGRAAGAVVNATVTITYIAYKRGLFTGLGPRCAGSVVLADLGVPDAAFSGVEPVAGILPDNLAARLLGPRRRDAHKGDSGHVLVVGGNHGMRGAAMLAGEAALRTGAGLVTLAVPPGYGAARAELMVSEVDTAESLQGLLDRTDVVAIGPGLGQDAWANTMLDAVLASPHPLVIDADALNLMAGRFRERGECIFTPHPGEAARLLGIDSAAVQADRYAALDELVASTRAVVVLKGAATLVGAADALRQVCLAGNPGMASGGMGDVLTGVIAALCAQGLEPHAAACAGVQLHAEAGDRAAALAGERGLLASDLMGPLHWRVNGLD